MNDIQFAKEFIIKHWVDGSGNTIEPIKLSTFSGKFKVIFCFQSWCPGCHTVGFPNLKKMVTALDQNPNIAFIAIQTVFEGFEENTYEKMLEMQKKYELNIPFGHDAGEDDTSTSNFMPQFSTGGTPWFILIDQKDEILFSDFHINVDAAIELLKNIE